MRGIYILLIIVLSLIVVASKTHFKEKSPTPKSLNLDFLLFGEGISRRTRRQKRSIVELCEHFGVRSLTPKSLNLDFCCLVRGFQGGQGDKSAA